MKQTSWKVLAIVGVCATALGAARAQDNPPPWWNIDDGNSTSICYRFTDASSAPDLLVNPFGLPEIVNNGALANPTVTDHEWVIGSPPGESSVVDFIIPNQARPDHIKLCWLQFDFYTELGAELTGGIFSDGSTLEIVGQEVVDIGAGWKRETVDFILRPQPQREIIRLEFDGGPVGTDNPGAWIDNFYFATHCVVPEPASMAALALGGLALLRRRKA